MSSSTSRKSQKARDLKTSKTRAMLFFLKCLNEAVDIRTLDEFSALSHLSIDEQQQLIHSFESLPHPQLMFFQMINTYRGKKILEILGETINPLHIKKFANLSSVEKDSKQNKIECQLIFSAIQSHQDAYQQVLTLFIDAFKKNSEIKWEKSEPDVLAMHLERQKKLFAQKQSASQMLKTDEGIKVSKSVLATPQNPPINETLPPSKTVSVQNAPVSAIKENKDLPHSSNVSSSQNVSQPIINTVPSQQTDSPKQVLSVDKKSSPPQNIENKIELTEQINTQVKPVASSSAASVDKSVTSQSTAKDDKAQDGSDNTPTKELSIYELAEPVIVKIVVTLFEIKPLKTQRHLPALTGESDLTQLVA